MLNKDDIKKIAKKIVHGKTRRKSLQIMHPTRDWLIGVVLAILMTVLVTAWSALTYVETRNLIGADAGSVAVNTVTYREALVDEALQIRASRYIFANDVQVVEVPAEIEVATSTPTSTESVATSTEELVATTSEEVASSTVEVE